MKMPSIPPVTLPYPLALALLVSACAHAALLAWPHPQAMPKKIIRSSGQNHRPALTVIALGRPITTAATSKIPSSTPASVKRVPAAMLHPIVVNVPPPPSTALTPQVTTLAAPAPPLAPAAPTPPTASPPAEAPTPAATASPVQPVPAPTASAPGQRFANLFAPILSEPLGRARWGRRQPEPMQLPPNQARQQALQALRTQLQQRLEAWRSAKLATKQDFDCELRIDYDHTQGSVICQDEQDTAPLWSLMQGLLRPLPAEDSAKVKTCLRLTATQFAEQACSAAKR